MKLGSIVFIFQSYPPSANQKAKTIERPIRLYSESNFWDDTIQDSHILYHKFVNYKKYYPSILSVATLPYGRDVFKIIIFYHHLLIINSNKITI